MSLKKLLPLIVLLVVAALLAACQGGPAEVEVPVEVTRIVEVPAEIDGMAITPEMIPFYEAWALSPHNDATAEAFNHWNEDDPVEVPTSCAKCHGTPGYQDFIGADGTEAGVVNTAAPIGSTITCVACHNDATITMDSVMMPSGIELTGLGDESRCMQCHQGRSSKLTVDEAITAAAVGDDEVSPDLGFINIHYFAAAATKYGTMAQGGYEYEGQSYDGFFTHIEGFETCIDCHDPHTLEIKLEECQLCHDVAGVDEFKDIRMPGSLVDYDGDGDLSEGTYYEIAGLQEVLYAAIQQYASDVIGVGIVYDAHAYPYFFIDGDGDGAVTEGEAAFPNRYASWTPRLVRAAYNYQVSQKDPGAFAHGGKYIIELLYDSITDLDEGLTANLRRIDHGHFAGSEEAFRHWDEEGEVPASCSRCHSAEGLPLYLEQGVTINQEVANGFLCSTCHTEENWPARFAATSVTFPSGVTLTTEVPTDSNLCMTCHQGRASGASVAGATAGIGANEVSENLRFINVHYFAAGATRYGADVNGMYEVDGNDYAGYFAHVPAADECTECHNAHTLQVQLDKCANCHEGIATEEDLYSIRANSGDWDGDGADEGVHGEIEGLKEALYAAMQSYAENAAGVSPLVYDAHAYPYYFTDTGDRYATWTPALLKAAYNYQYASKDPGAFTHNAAYVAQALYDSIVGLGGDVSGLTRP